MSKGRVAVDRVRARSQSVFRTASERLESVVSPVCEDLSADPYLRYVLLLALFTCGFGIWFRVPNFADPDEYSRLIQPMKVAGRTAADPSFESLQAALTDGRALGATIYLYGAVLVPVSVVVVFTGQLGEFVTLGSLESRWELWHAAPAWFWTSAVVLGRLISVALGVGCVYLTYRIGVAFRDRVTGRVAALSLALSVGFLSQAHLVGEDVPMLFFLLLTVLLATRYVDSGDRRTFLLGCLAGGLAIAFKLTGGVAAIVLGVAHLDYARRQTDSTDALLRPAVVLGGVAVGLVTVLVGIPSALVAGPDEVVGRIVHSLGTKTGRSGGLAAPIWFWLLRGYVAGTGLPLTIAATVGTLDTVGTAVRRSDGLTPLGLLLATTVIVPLAVFAQWEFVRIRHVVPLFPALFVAFGAAASRFQDLPAKQDGLVRRRAVTVALALVFLTTGPFVAAAEYQYITEPRDQATEWFETNTDKDASIEVYENSIADVGVPHGRQTTHYAFPEERATNTSTLVLNETAYTEWMVSMPDRSPDYVQLTSEELASLDSRNPASAEYPKRRAYVEGLLAGEYDYRVATEFGTRPATGNQSLAERLFEAGTRPTVDGVERVIVVLERTG